MDWPVTLTEGPVQLRPLRYREARAWMNLRADNRQWLAPWEATSPTMNLGRQSFRALVRSHAKQARAGTHLSLAVVCRDQLVGHICLGPVFWGSMRSAGIGYWVSSKVAGQGITPTAVALLTDHALLSSGLHRVEINIRPENVASLRVVEKLGFRDEGLRRRFLHIDGAWRDHRTFALTIEDVPNGLMMSWRERIRREGNPVPHQPGR
jgi:ribosomal-protein-alanine N-acetyltransferase